MERWKVTALLGFLSIIPSFQLTAQDTSTIDRGVRIPEGLVVGEDPALDGQRFRRTESGICLITQPMIDKLSA